MGVEEDGVAPGLDAVEAGAAGIRVVLRVVVVIVVAVNTPRDTLCCYVFRVRPRLHLGHDRFHGDSAECDPFHGLDRFVCRRQNGETRHEHDELGGTAVEAEERPVIFFFAVDHEVLEVFQVQERSFS